MNFSLFRTGVMILIMKSCFMKSRFEYKMIRVVCLASALLAAGCGEKHETSNLSQEELTVSEKTTIFKIDNRLFYIPNPVQSALLIKELAKTYNREIISSSSKVEDYSTSFQQAINIGAFGADLGYITAFDQNQDVINHLGAVKKLADKLGISSVFDFSTMEKLSGNMGNKNEMLSAITGAYKRGQDFLQDNDRKELAGLMMAGAWVESMFLATNLGSLKPGVTPDQDIINRIGEQQNTLESVILILNPFYSTEDAPELSQFVDQLTELQQDFKGVRNQYTFKETTCEASAKTCTINSENTIVMSELLLVKIATKIKEIRDFVTS